MHANQIWVFIFHQKKNMQNQPQNFMYVCCDFLKATTKKQNLDSQEHNINININI